MALFNPSPSERKLLWIVAIIGLLGPNGMFVYYLLFQPEVTSAAFGNPVALTFIIDALAATFLLAYLLARRRVSRLGWSWFIVLGLLGGLLFAIPAFLHLGASPTDDDGNHHT
ncbi:MAG: hypothetical protein EXR51_09620 [Dehalococcoidia bacterium]|nr:hypothetical protein [Dehalococcoidia bacterium]